MGFHKGGVQRSNIAVNGGSSNLCICLVGKGCFSLLVSPWMMGCRMQDGSFFRQLPQCSHSRKGAMQWALKHMYRAGQSLTGHLLVRPNLHLLWQANRFEHLIAKVKGASVC